MARNKINLYECFSKWREFNCLYIHADTHFDDNMFGDFIVDSEAVVSTINRRVGKKDAIIFLGDCGNLEWFKKVKGYKILIKGNHDDKAKETYYEYFDEVYDGAVIVNEKLVLSHEPFVHPNFANLHGHDHSGWFKEPTCVNLCDKGVLTLEEAVGLLPGGMKRITSMHRCAIDGQKERKHGKSNRYNGSRNS